VAGLRSNINVAVGIGPAVANSRKWAVKLGRGYGDWVNRRQYNSLSTHPVKYHFLFDQPKRCKEGLILQALQDWLRIPFLITPVAEGHTKQLTYWDRVSHRLYRPLKIGQLLPEVRIAN
jgi:hypothetical protein